MPTRLRVAFLVIGAALFVHLVTRIGTGAVLDMLGRIGFAAIPLAGIYAAHEMVRAVALAAAVPGPRPVRVRDALWIRLSGEAIQFFSFTGPFLAEPAKAWLLRRRGLGTSEGVAATLTEYLAYTFTSAAFSIAAFGWLVARGTRLDPQLRLAVLGLIVAMALFLAAGTWAIIRRFYLIGTILERIAALPLLRRKLHPDMRAVHSVEEFLLVTMHDQPVRFARILALEGCSQVLLALELYGILHVFDLAAGLGVAAMLEGSTKFVGLAFFFVPGQVGASEAVHMLLFEAVGLPVAAGFAVPFVRRIRSLVIACLGLLSLSMLTQQDPGGKT